MNRLIIEILPALRDNYIYLLEDYKTNTTAVIDPGDPFVVLKALEKQSLSLDYIFNTHHHPDHTGGNLLLKEKTDCLVVGAKKDKLRIPGIDIELVDGDCFKFGNHNFHIIETPGHTNGAICWLLKESNTIFTGDTYFAMGCGRLFEGTPEEMWKSLEFIKSLDPQTMIYCGHEYSVKNTLFSLSVDPTSLEIKSRLDYFEDLISMKKPTVPISLGEELATNLFLKCNEPYLKNLLDLKASCVDWKAFAKLRELRDQY